MSLLLVTGGAGFIGSALVRELLARGEWVRVMDNLSTGKEANLSGSLACIEFVEGDIRSAETVARAMKGVERVIHLAAIPSVPRSVADPMSTNRTNVEGTLNVLLQAREARVKRVVYASSSSVYGASPKLPKVENDPLDPLSPYAVSKLAGEYYLHVFSRLFGMETVSLRYFNVFGPRQDASSPYAGVLCRFITALLQGEPPVINGDGTQSRDFTYVENAVDATLRACFTPGLSAVTLNVATSIRYSLNQALEILGSILGTNTPPPRYGATRPGDVPHSLADISRARVLLGYEPRVSFEEGLRRTVSWYQHLADGGS